MFPASTDCFMVRDFGTTNVGVKPVCCRQTTLVEAHYPALVDQLVQQGKSLPDHVHREFEAPAEGQPHPLPRRTRAEPSLARARHASQARERHQVHLQRRSPHTCRTSCSNDLGPAPKTCVQYRHRGLRPLRWFCEGDRLHRRPGHHRQDTGSPSQ